MENKMIFNFKNWTGAPQIISALDLILQEFNEVKTGGQQEKNKFSEIDNNLINEFKILLKSIPSFDDIVLPYLDDHSIHTRTEYPNIVNNLQALSESAENISQLKKLIPHTLNSIFDFFALISEEIVYRFYSNPINEHKGEADILKNIFKAMTSYKEQYLLSDKVALSEKNKIKNYSYLIQTLENETLYKKEVSANLREYSTKLGNFFKGSITHKKIERYMVLFFMGVIGIVLLWGAASMSSTFITSPVEFFERFFGFSRINSPTQVLLTNDNNVQFDWLKLSSFIFSLLLFYFFNLLLRRNKELKTEIIQLETRKILSEFLPAYAEFSKHHLDNPVIPSFSDFIFKPLVFNSNDIPKMTDSLASIANLIGKINAKTKE